jgi:ring-1,2-phenylacetyl-CoA epoxidase subunit PaaA
VPQSEVLGLSLPDPDLRLDEATGHYTFGAIDWSEFFAVLKGDGPCNAERIEHRRRAHDEGAWVRDAASAYAAKQAARQTAEVA